MKIAVFGLVVCLASSLSFGAFFSEDFESNSLDQWSIDGRLNVGEDDVQIVNRHDSKMAYVHHGYWTETWLKTTVDYRDDLNFSFDMETSVHTTVTDPHSDSYSRSGAVFQLFNESGERLGRVNYSIESTTSDNIFWDDLRYHINYIQPGLHSYSLSIQDIISNIAIDTTKIAYVDLIFESYCSTNIVGVYAETWVDNVEIVPEPASALLLTLGGALVLRKRRSI